MLLWDRQLRCPVIGKLWSHGQIETNKPRRLHVEVATLSPQATSQKGKRQITLLFALEPDMRVSLLISLLYCIFRTCSSFPFTVVGTRLFDK